jgi:acyl transferase domain-containing protein/NADP-dependent 3-hydroxy acid dehydrogenase YdfG/acyl carrier protein
MTDGSTGVAVVGMGCRFPGGVASRAAFWEMLRLGRDVVGPMPSDRFDIDRFLDPEPQKPGKMVAAEGGFLDRVDLFDAAFFGISPREAAKMDPQQRLLLEVVWEALEDGGIPAGSIAGRRTGVYVGVWSGEYENVIYRAPEDLDFHALTGGGRYAASGRISWAYDFRGPCVTVDSGCSASLSALHMARRAIADGEIDVAIVGAANLILQPHVSIGYSRSGMLSPGARCRFGDADAAGYVRSEGVAAVVLERVDRAREHRHTVRATILDSAVNADGRGSGQLATPSSEAQAELLETVWSRSEVGPGSVPYVEAHGTGTRVGDPVELQALGSVLGSARPADRPLRVGSVKTNMGHTEACAGLAGLFKAVLALEHRTIPANLHFSRPNPDIAWNELGITIPTEATPWPTDAPLVAGVSSFGITGTNAHAIVAVEPAVDGPAPAASHTPTPHVVVLSAASEEALQVRIRDLRDRLREDGAPSLPDLSYTTTVRREHLSHRIALVSNSTSEVSAVLDELLDRGSTARLIEGVAAPATPPRVAFVFSGQGSQWAGMGRELLASSRVFADTIDRCDGALEGVSELSIRSVLEGRGPDPETVDVIQPTLVAVQIGIARQLQSHGIHPDAVVGHSMGEVAAAHVAGALTIEDAMRVVATRSRLLSEIAGRGAMGLVDLGRDDILEHLRPFADRLAIAAQNGPRSTVLSGDPDALDQLLARLDAADVFCRRVRVDVASHSPQCDPLLPRLRQELDALSPTAPDVPFHSTPLATAMGDEPLDADYWARNLRGAVRLDETVRGMIEAGIDTFVEISPHPILLSSLADIAAGTGTRVRSLGSLRREEPEMERVLDALARLHVSGVAVDWNSLAAKTARPVELPPYPWQRERHWLDRWEDWSGDDVGASVSTWPDEATGWLHGLQWEEVAVPVPSAPPLSGRWLFVSDPSPLADAIGDLLPSGSRVVDPESADGLEEALATGGSTIDGVVVLGRTDSKDDRAATAFANCDTVRRLVQALDARGGTAPRVVIATRGGRQTTSAPGAEARVDAAAAALWGFGRALRDEQPELGLRLVDLDPAADASEAATAVLEVLATPSLQDDLVHRAGAWLSPRLAREAPPRLERSFWPSRGATLITGGLGDLGLAVARHLAEIGSGPLVLLSRTPLPPRSEWVGLDTGTPVGARVATLRALEQRGVAVEAHSVDVSDGDALDAFLRSREADARPEIVAVVHAAGTLDSHLVRDLSAEALERVLAGKAAGAFALDRAFPDVERFVLFSSTSAMMPHPGEANYAAANAVLDALAEDRRGRGLEAQSINWGVWRDSGLIADEHGARYVEELGRQGIGSMPPDIAVRVLAWLAGSGHTRAFVAPIDWEQYGGSRSEDRIDPLFRALAVDTAAQSRSVRDDLRGLPERERVDALRDLVREIAGNVLGVGGSGVRQGVTFGAQGMDSLMAMEFRNHLEARLRIAVSATIAWNYPTLDALAAYLSQQLAGESTPDSHDTAPTRDDQPDDVIARHARDVAGLSDDEALRELLGDR